MLRSRRAPTAVERVESDVETQSSAAVRVVVAQTLDELPEGRRETLLWKHALHWTYEDVEESLDSPRHHMACDARYRHQGPGSWVGSRAVLGSDSLFHLRLGEKLVCGVPHTNAGRPWVAHRCIDSILPSGKPNAYYPDPNDRRLRHSALDSATSGLFGRDAVEKAWATELTAEEVDPDQVPHGRRCPGRLGFGAWPTYADPTTAKGRQRIQLTKALGPMCAGCGDAWGVYIDHDHFSGYVRGLLCRICNNKIDYCPHLSGCRWADYLDNPPAAPLQMLYTDRAQDRRRDQRKIEVTGLDPYLA